MGILSDHFLPVLQFKICLALLKVILWQCKQGKYLIRSGEHNRECGKKSLDDLPYGSSALAGYASRCKGGHVRRGNKEGTGKQDGNGVRVYFFQHTGI